MALNKPKSDKKKVIYTSLEDLKNEQGRIIVGNKDDGEFDITDLDEKTQHAFIRKFGTVRGYHFNRLNLDLTNSDINMWASDWHCFPSGHLDEKGQFSPLLWKKHLNNCLTQYDQRLPLRRNYGETKVIEKDKKVLLYSGVTFNEEEDYTQNFEI